MLRPRLRADYLSVCMPGAGSPYLLVLGETRNLLIEDEAAAGLAGLLDGTLDVAALVGALGAAHQPRAVARALRKLGDLGLLADGPVSASGPAAAAWDARGVDPDLAQAWPASGKVVIADAGSPALPALVRSLEAAGLAVRQVSAADLTEADLASQAGSPVQAPVVVAPASMTDPVLGHVNAACLRAGAPWLLVRPHGLVLLLGPHLVPGQTGCWECLRQRWTGTCDVDAFLAAQFSGDGQPPSRVQASSDALAGALAGLLAAELPVLASLGRSERVTGAMVALDTRDLTTSRHELVALPQCPACGDPGLLRGDGPVVLRPASPGSGQGCADELAERRAERTCARLERQVSSYLGVIGRVAPVPLDRADVITCYSVTHPFVPATGPADLRQQLRGLSGGKGRTPAQARASALGEAVERYCGLWRGDRPAAVRSSFDRLDPAEAVHPRDLLNFSAAQYSERAKRNAGLAHFHRIPRPLAGETEIDWTAGWSLTGERRRLLPSAYCWYGHPDLAATPVCGTDSNGCAAGETLAEAVLAGFCELAERDSVALWWYHRSLVPGVDLDSFADPWLDRVREQLASRLDREVWVLDISADLPVPAYAAVSRNTARPTEDIIVGFAADLDPAAAVRSAVAEVCQFLPTVARFDGTRTRYGLTDRWAVQWLTSARLDEQPWLAPDPGQPASTRASHGGPPAGDAAALASYCVQLAAAAGLEVIVVDQSRPEIELAVARVVVPGLRHFWRRLGPGRLWDVPAALGRFPLAAGEESVNPYSVFF